MEKINLIYKKHNSFIETGHITGSLPSKKRKKILRNVTIIHVSLIVIPAIWYAVSYFFIPKKSVIKVTLVSPPSSSNYQTSAPLQKKIEKQEHKTQKTPSPRKEIPKRHTEQKRKVKKRVTPKKPVIKKKSSWHPKTLHEITISKKVVKNNQPTKRVTQHKISANEIESKLRRVYSINNNTSPVQTSQGNVSANYRDKLYTAIYRLWNQPAKSELGGRYPVVDITLTVESSGRVSSARISHRSGVKAMDSSVDRLLKNLKRLPPPSAGRMQFTISLEIVD